MHAHPPLAVLLVPFVAFPIVLYLTLAFVSRLGGWGALARRFPDPMTKRPSERVFGWKSVAMSAIARYNNCINIGVSEQGLSLRPTFLIAPMHPPIFMPWQDVGNVEFNPNGWFCEQAGVRAGGRVIRFYGAPARAIHEAFVRSQRHA
jgi:hypothetical protein